MKITFQLLACAQWCFHLCQAGVIKPVIEQRISPHPNLHSKYNTLVDGVMMTTELLEQGYTGELKEYTLDVTFTPTTHYVNTKDLAVRNTLIVRADVCVYLTDCAGLLKDYVAFYAIQGANGLVDWCQTAATTFSNYFTTDNYVNAYAVLNGAISNLALLVPITATQYYLNAQFAKISPTTSDACGTTQPPVMAEQAANAVFEFCLSVKNQVVGDVTTRFSAADLNNPDANYDENSGDGNDLIMKFNFGSLEFDVLALCTANGITWRRDFAAALRRGAERSKLI